MTTTLDSNVHLRRPALVAVAAGLIGVAAPAAAQTGHNQPRMYEALNALYAARSSLESGATNKGGYRLQALAHIRQAIQDIKTGIDYAN